MLTIFVTICLGYVTISAVKVQPRVKCSPEQMRVEIPLMPDIKAIYLQGLRDYPDPACKPQIDPTKSTYVFQLNLTNVFQCGITRVVNQITGKQVYYKTIVTEIESHQKERQQEIIHVKCSLLPIKLRSLVRRDVLPAGFQEPEDLDIIKSVIEHAPVPVLGVGVRQNGNLVTGELNVSPGTPLQMEIFLDKNSSDVYGLLVTHMQVTDTKAQEETIVYNGCSVDPYLFENFNTIDGDFLSAKFRAFKFPESTYVQFKGTVNVCLDKCQGVECSDGQIGYGRKKREVSTLPADPNKIFEITITSFIKVNYENESDSFEKEMKFTKDNGKMFIVGSQEKRIIKEVEELASNRGITKLIENEQITSVIANMAAKNTAIFILILGISLRLIM